MRTKYVVAFLATLVAGYIVKASVFPGTSEDEQNAFKSEAKHTVRFVYDTANGGGAIGTHDLGVSLPANAYIIRSYLHITTLFEDSGSGTVAIHCEDANNIKTATDLTGSSAGDFVEGQSTGAMSAAKDDIAAGCIITATVATATQNAGRLVGFAEYVLGD